MKVTFLVLNKCTVRVWEGFPCGSAGKESACNAGDMGSIPGLGRSPGEGKGYPLQYSGLENSMDCIIHGVTKSWTWLSDFHFHFKAVAYFFYLPLSNVNIMSLVPFQCIWWDLVWVVFKMVLKWYGLPRCRSGKESTCQCRRFRFNPCAGRSPREGNGNPLQYSCLENSMDRGAWQASVHLWAREESDST